MKHWLKTIIIWVVIVSIVLSVISLTLLSFDVDPTPIILFGIISAIIICFIDVKFFYDLEKEPSAQSFDKGVNQK